jgi:cellulose synthase/poly-beta-1,6-N-acetylglucosamine synthase-like glycosyltransferase
MKTSTIKISVIVTVKNDREGEKKLRQALSQQTRKPDEVIIIRAEEHDNCSRAEGRNIGIRQAKYDFVAVTDAGCTPHRDWIERLIGSLRHLHEGFDLSGRSDPSTHAIVVSGFYRVITKTPFQEAIAPYLAVLPYQWDKNCLPASRSIAFTKRAWELVGGYPQRARSGAEDLVFAARLAKHPDATVIQAPDALVDWEPPRTLTGFFADMVKHTRGNLESRYWPHLLKNYSVLFRWLLFLLIPWLIPFYLVWPIVKHGQTIKKGLSFSGPKAPKVPKALCLLPVVQLLADAAVIIALVW